MEAREIETVATEVEATGVASAPPKKKRRTWRIVGVIAGVLLLLCIGAAVGGGLVYAWTGGRGARHAGVVIVPRPVDHIDGLFFSRSSRKSGLSDVVCHLDSEASFEAIEHGILILDVMDDSPAAAAGLKTCDIITHIDGESVEDADSLSDAVAAQEPGDKVTVTVYTPDEDETVEVPVTLGEHPDDEALAYLGVRVGGAFKIDIACDDGDCDSLFFRRWGNLSGEMDDALRWLPEGDDGIRFFISPGEVSRPGFLFRWRLDRDGIELPFHREDEI